MPIISSPVSVFWVWQSWAGIVRVETIVLHNKSPSIHYNNNAMNVKVSSTYVAVSDIITDCQLTYNPRNGLIDKTAVSPVLKPFSTAVVFTLFWSSLLSYINVVLRESLQSPVLNLSFHLQSFSHATGLHEAAVSDRPFDSASRPGCRSDIYR